MHVSVKKQAVEMFGCSCYGLQIEPEPRIALCQSHPGRIRTAPKRPTEMFYFPARERRASSNDPPPRGWWEELLQLLIAKGRLQQKSSSASFPVSGSSRRNEQCTQSREDWGDHGVQPCKFSVHFMEV